MTKRTWIYVTIALIALLSVFAIAVYASPVTTRSYGFKSRMKARKAEKVGQLLGITDEQREKIVSTLEIYREDFKPLIEGMMNASRDLRDTVTSDKFDEKAIRDKASLVSEYKVELAVLIGKVYQDVKVILTPEQIELINEFKEMRQNHTEDFLDWFDKVPDR